MLNFWWVREASEIVQRAGAEVCCGHCQNLHPEHLWCGPGSQHILDPWTSWIPASLVPEAANSQPRAQNLRSLHRAENWQKWPWGPKEPPWRPSSITRGIKLAPVSDSPSRGSLCINIHLMSLNWCGDLVISKCLLLSMEIFHPYDQSSGGCTTTLQSYCLIMPMKSDRSTRGCLEEELANVHLLGPLLALNLCQVSRKRSSFNIWFLKNQTQKWMWRKWSLRFTPSTTTNLRSRN